MGVSCLTIAKFHGYYMQYRTIFHLDFALICSQKKSKKFRDANKLLAFVKLVGQVIQIRKHIWAVLWHASNLQNPERAENNKRPGWVSRPDMVQFRKWFVLQNALENSWFTAPKKRMFCLHFETGLVLVFYPLEKIITDSLAKDMAAEQQRYLEVFKSWLGISSKENS